MLPKTMTTNPAVATTSASRVPDEMRSWSDSETASSSNIRLASTQPTTPPNTWAATNSTASRVVTETEHALDRGDDRVEAGRDRLERQDQRDQGGPGDETVHQQLQARVARRESLGRDAGADDGHHEERRTDRFRGHPTTEAHPATPPISAPRSPRASGWTR